MMTQLFDDESLKLFKNTPGDKGKLRKICDALERLGDQQVINTLIEDMQRKGILTDKEIEVLEVKGVYQDPQADIELYGLQQDENEHDNTNDNDEMEIGDD